MNKFLNKSHIALYLGIDRRKTLTKYMKQKDFPKPAEGCIANMNYWHKEDIDIWISKVKFPIGKAQTKKSLTAWSKRHLLTYL